MELYNYMEKEKLHIYFSTGYAGKIKVGAIINGIDYVIEPEYLKEKLEKEISEKGYTTAMSKRQKYPRLIIND